MKLTKLPQRRHQESVRRACAQQDAKTLHELQVATNRRTGLPEKSLGFQPGDLRRLNEELLRHFAQ